MDFDRCVEFLRENFQDIPREKIAESVNLYIVKIYEKGGFPEKGNPCLNENDLLELMEELPKWKEKEEIKVKNADADEVQRTKDIYANEDKTGNGKKGLLEHTKANASEHLKSNKNKVTKLPDVEKYVAKCEQKDDNGETVVKHTETETNQVELKTGLNVVSTFFEIIFNKPLLEDENIQKNIEAKNFYIINKDMLINIVIILEKIITHLIIYYNENEKKKDEQISHFQNFFKIMYTLLNNIYIHPNEDKYRTIKFSNSQVRSFFLINEEIFGTTEILFQMLKFNTSSCKNEYNQDTTHFQKKGGNKDEEKREDGMSEKREFSKTGNAQKEENVDQKSQKTEYFKLIWKFENVITDVESILFEFVLSSIKIILNKVNNGCNNQNKNETHKKEFTNNKTSHFGITSSNEQKHTPELPGKQHLLYNPSNVNSKVAMIHQKNEEKKREIDDIRKLYDERYQIHKKYEDQNSSQNFSFSKNKEKNKNKEEGNKRVSKSMFSNHTSSNEDINEKKNKNKKKIKQWFKKVFKAEKN